MNKFLTGPARMASLAAIALTLAACEPDDGARSGLTHFALGGAHGPLDMALQDQLLGGGLGGALPAALPLLAGGGRNYGYAPSWDYVSDGYVDYAPQDPYDYYGYDDGSYDEGYYDEGYYGDDYYDASAGSGDFTWLALAALIAGVIGDSPPDYGYDYHGVQPWAWRTSDGYNRFVEPVYGGNRYYYYAPGAAGPFLVRDPYFSYAYQDDRLVALYDRDGRVIDARAAKRHRQAAQQYLVRAKDLYRAASVDDRTGVFADQWERRRAGLAEDRRQWGDARAEQAAWRQWDQRNEQAVRQNWQREAAARREAAEQFVSWREDAYRGAAPRFYAAQARPDRQVVATQQARPERQRRAERVAMVEPGERAAARVERQPQVERRAEVREQREVRHQDRARPERLAAADAARQQVRAERQVAQARSERPVEAGRQRAGERQQRQARVERQVAQERQQQARAERQAQADRQRSAAQEQRQARVERQAAQERQQQARAERQAQQQRQAAQQQERQAQQQARAEQQQQQQRQAAQEQQRQVQQQARAEQQQRQAAQEQQRQAQQQARAERQAAAAAEPAGGPPQDEERRGGKKGGRS